MRLSGHVIAMRGFVAAVIGLLALTGCDRVSTIDRIGATMSDERGLQILYLACDYEQIAALRVVAGNDPNDREDNEVLWEIRSQAGGGGGAFIVGAQSAGFTETVEVAGTLPQDDLLIAAVELEDSVGAAVSFKLADLEVGKVWAPGSPAANIDAEAFEQRARDSCHGGQ